MKISFDQLGQGRAYPNPADALAAANGSYRDMANEMTPEEKLPTSAFPMAPAPTAFAVVRRMGGSR